MVTGTYKYKRYFGTDGRGNRVFREYTMRVEVVGEKYKRYRVKYLGADFTKGPVNSLHWVQKDSVTLDPDPFACEVMPDKPITPPGRSSLDIRLPYKDDE